MSVPDLLDADISGSKKPLLLLPEAGKDPFGKKNIALSLTFNFPFSKEILFFSVSKSTLSASIHHIFSSQGHKENFAFSKDIFPLDALAFSDSPHTN